MGMYVAILVQEDPETAIGHLLSDDEDSCWGPLTSLPAVEERLLMDFWRMVCCLILFACSTQKNIQVPF